MTMSSRDAGASDAVAMTAEQVRVPAPGSEERSFWLEAAAHHGFEELDDDPIVYLATEDEVLALMAAARQQGRNDVAALSPPAVPVPEEVRRLSEAATPGPWASSFQEMDDWGTIRTAVADEDGFHPVVCSARVLDDHAEQDTARAERREPRITGANTAFIAAAANFVRTLLAAPQPEPPKLGPQSWQDMERMPIGEVNTVLLSAAPPAGRADEGGESEPISVTHQIDAITRKRFDSLSEAWNSGATLDEGDLSFLFRIAGLHLYSRGSPAEADTRYQYREIGEGEDWKDCTQEVHDSYARDPHMDTRAIPPTAPAADSGRMVPDQRSAWARAAETVGADKPWWWDKPWADLGYGSRGDVQAWFQGRDPLRRVVEPDGPDLYVRLHCDPRPHMLDAAPAPAGATEDGWIFDMEAAPRDGTSVLVAVPSIAAPFVGEAYIDSENGGHWWWAGTNYGDYHAAPLRETGHMPYAWHPMLEAPAPPAEGA